MKRWLAAVVLAWIALLIAVGKRAWLQLDRINYRMHNT